MTHEPPTGWDASTHPDLERLAELEEGLLDSADAARVAEHVAGCEHCRSQQAELEHARALLRGLPADTMPADVAARLDAALASADLDAPGASSQPATVVPLNAARRRWGSRPTVAGLGAAAAVTALVVALVVGHNTGGSSGGSTSPEGATSLAQSAAGSVLSNLSTESSGTDYTTGNLASTVPQLVAGPAAHTMMKAAPAPAQPKTGAAPNAGGASATVAGIPAALLRLHDSPSALRSCVLGVEAGGQIQRPLAIDFARYLGAPAVLIVLPGLNPGYVDAWFVGPGCDSVNVHLLGYKAIASSASPSPGS